jgi:hypothetical protein
MPKCRSSAAMVTPPAMGLIFRHLPSIWSWKAFFYEVVGRPKTLHGFSCRMKRHRKDTEANGPGVK